MANRRAIPPGLSLSPGEFFLAGSKQWILRSHICQPRLAPSIRVRNKAETLVTPMDFSTARLHPVFRQVRKFAPPRILLPAHVHLVRTLGIIFRVAILLTGHLWQKYLYSIPNQKRPPWRSPVFPGSRYPSNDSSARAEQTAVAVALTIPKRHGEMTLAHFESSIKPARCSRILCRSAMSSAVAVLFPAHHTQTLCKVCAQILQC